MRVRVTLLSKVTHTSAAPLFHSVYSRRIFAREEGDMKLGTFRRHESLHYVRTQTYGGLYLGARLRAEIRCC